jgi:hypothetical protein
MADMEQDITENASGEEEQQEQLPQNDPPQMQQQAAASAPPAQQNKKGNRKQPEHPCVACGKNVSSNAVQCTMCTLVPQSMYQSVE